MDRRRALAMGIALCSGLLLTGGLLAASAAAAPGRRDATSTIRGEGRHQRGGLGRNCRELFRRVDRTAQPRAASRFR